MAKRKIIIDELEDNLVKVGIGKFGDSTSAQLWKDIKAPLETVIAMVPDLLKEWAGLPPSRLYKAPPEPKKETKTAASKPAAGKTAEELPLLSGTEPAPVKAEATAEVKAEEPTEVKAEAVAEDTAPPVEVVVTPAPEQPAAVVVAGEEKTAMSKMAEQAPAVPAAAPAATPATPSGEWQYWLEDGRGPYNTVQEAMDAKGLDKATRPQHNRWDRLSTELKKAILRKPKV